MYSTAGDRLWEWLISLKDQKVLGMAIDEDIWRPDWEDDTGNPWVPNIDEILEKLYWKYIDDYE